MLRGVSAKMSHVLDTLQSCRGRDADEAATLIYEALVRRTVGAEEVRANVLSCGSAI